MPGISPREVELIASISEKGLTVFTLEEASILMGVNKATIVKLANNLVKKRKLQRIERGKYLLIPPAAWKEGKFSEQGIVVASQLIHPYYISYWTALNLYGWTEQPSQTIFVATTKIKKSLTVQGVSFRFVRLKANRFFGHVDRWVGAQKVTIADREKTIVDCLDQPRYCGEIVEVAKGIWNGRDEVDFEKVLNYADRMKNGAILKRLGYLMEALGILTQDYHKKLAPRIRRGYVDLDPGAAKSAVTKSPKWQIRVNVKPENLTEWKNH